MASSDLVATTPEKDAPFSELAAPQGWQKQISYSKKGSTPSKRDVYFLAPDGEKITSKRALERYLKSHPGNPPVAEFDWSTGETPTRRSSRLSSRTRPSIDSPGGGSAGKRAKKVVEELSKAEEKEEPQAEEKPAPEEKEEPQAEEKPVPEEKEAETKPDEIMEDAGKEVDKTLEESGTADDVEKDAKQEDEMQPEKAVETSETVAETEHVKMDVEEKETEATAEVSTVEVHNEEPRAEETVTQVEETPISEKQESNENTAPSLKEDGSELKESSEKISNAFQQCPEAPPSRQVDVST